MEFCFKTVLQWWKSFGRNRNSSLGRPLINQKKSHLIIDFKWFRVHTVNKPIFLLQKPVTRKKKFIDPKREETQTFALIHRSQKDPLAADSDAPQRLLKPLPSKDEIKKSKEEEREFGVFYDDDYDYLQHLKSREEFFEADLQEVEKFELKSNEKYKLPKEVFASDLQEEEIGLLNKGKLF